MENNNMNIDEGEAPIVPPLEIPPPDNWNNNMNNEENRRMNNERLNMNGVNNRLNRPRFGNIRNNPHNRNRIRDIFWAKPMVVNELKPEEVTAALTHETRGPYTALGEEDLAKVEDYIGKVFQKTYEAYQNGSRGTTPIALAKSDLPNAKDAIKKLLKDTGAIVAGGFLLNALGLKPLRNDIDLYVNCKNLSAVNQVLPRWANAGDMREVISAPYCSSFLKRNGIRSVQSFSVEDDDIYAYINTVQIMAVRNKRQVTDVVQNFDLTFCQIWYDGEKVYATHPYHVYKKVGYLQKDYIPLFLGGNMFLRKRIAKYTYQGFIVQMDPDYIQTQILPHMSPCPTTERNDTFFKKWSNKALLEYLLNNSYEIKAQYPVNILRLNTSVGKWKGIQTNATENHFKAGAFGSSDGYDSDDYSEPADFNELAKKWAEKYAPDLADLPERMIFYHAARRMVQGFYSSDPNNNSYIQRLRDAFHGYDMEDEWDLFHQTYSMKKIMKYYTFINELTTRVGLDSLMYEEDVKVYDFHHHNDQEGISRDSLETYLDPYKGEKDKNTVPCYNKGNGCEQPLTLEEITPCVSLEFLKKYVEGGKPKEVVELVNAVNITAFQMLENVRTATDGWGELYHHVICPFCLVSEERDKGCSYMVHENKKALPYRESPYCKELAIVPELRNKYVAAARDHGLNLKLEFCVECGRPSNGHAHFGLGESPGLVMAVRQPGEPADVQYTKCAGGGRAELFARVLAMRKVLREYTGDDIQEMRRLAAFAADAAPLDEALMAKARAILEQPPAERKWGNTEEAAAAPAAAADIAPENVPGPANLFGENADQLGGNCPYCAKKTRHPHPKFPKTKKRKSCLTRKTRTARKAKN